MHWLKSQQGLTNFSKKLESKHKRLLILMKLKMLLQLLLKKAKKFLVILLKNRRN